MIIKYLGTAASEAVPAPFCECETCEYARRHGGRNIQTRAQALIDGKVLLDFGPDTFMHTILHRFKLSDVAFCLITHPHEDHLAADELGYRYSYAAHMKNEHPFVMCGVGAAIEAIRKGRFTADLEKQGLLVLKEIVPFVPFEIEGYRITALKADHGTPNPVFYIIEKDGQALLYAHDTGFFPEETMAYLASIETKFDFVSYDCTNVLLEWNNRGHMGLTGNTIMRERLKEIGKIKDSTIHVVNHFSHNGLAGYDQLMPKALAKGFQTSFDGMEIAF